MIAPVRYAIAARSPDAHLFEVRCTVEDPDLRGQQFRLPTWIPGSYLVREFARNFVTVRAECGKAGSPVAIGKTAKDTWQCAPCAGSLTVIAEVYAWDLSVRGAHFDRTHAFFNGTSVFLSPAGMEERACIVDIAPPAGEHYAAWRLITSLPRDGATPYGFGRYRASNYDELVDHPVEMGTFTLAAFDAGGVQHDVAITGRHDCDTARLTADLAKICTAQIDFFGGAAGSRPPMDYYVFFVMALGDAYGGLEHRASTALVIGRDKLPRIGMQDPSDDYIEFLGLASHEYFHTWNVKRIKPAAFVPYDLTQEAYTRQLWIFEGFTSYYDNLLLLRSSVITKEQYVALLARDITKVLRGSGRTKQSVADSSFDAWIKYYRQDENAPNAIVSYYVKGALVALLLDLRLRRMSPASLDAVMQALWQRYGQAGIGVPEDGVRRIAQELAGPGVDMADFFARYVDGTEELPLAEELAALSIELHLRAADGNKDDGGKPAKASKEGQPRQSLGARWTAGGDARITHVFDGGAAQAAGLAAGDVILAWNGLKVTAGTLQGRVARAQAGERAQVHAFRRDELMVFEVALTAAPLDTCWLTLSSDAPETAVRLRGSWFQGAAATD